MTLHLDETMAKERALGRAARFADMQDEGDAQTRLNDMLADLRHWAHEYGADWTDADRISSIHFEAEQNGEDV